MSLAAVLGALAGGFGVPLRHLVEGMFGYIDTILIIACAMIFMKTVQHIGLLDALAAWGIRRFRSVPLMLCALVTFLVMLPGMLTGSSTVNLWLWHSTRALLIRTRASALRPAKAAQI